MTSSPKMIPRSLTRWFSKSFVNKSISVIWVTLLSLMSEERVFPLVEPVDWKGNAVNFKKSNVYLTETMLTN